MTLSQWTFKWLFILTSPLLPNRYIFLYLLTVCKCFNISFCFNIFSMLTVHICVQSTVNKLLPIWFFLHKYFYTPVFRWDVLWHGDVRPSGSPSVRPTSRQSVRPTLRPGLRPSVFRTFLIHALTYWAEILHMTLF